MEDPIQSFSLLVGTYYLGMWLTVLGPLWGIWFAKRLIFD